LPTDQTKVDSKVTLKFHTEVTGPSVTETGESDGRADLRKATMNLVLNTLS
jgi:hypothetical protein